MAGWIAKSPWHLKLRYFPAEAVDLPSYVSSPSRLYAKLGREQRPRRVCCVVPPGNSVEEKPHAGQASTGRNSLDTSEELRA